MIGCYLLLLLLVGKKVTLVLAFFFFFNIDLKLESITIFFFFEKITFYYLRFIVELL